MTIGCLNMGAFTTPQFIRTVRPFVLWILAAPYAQRWWQQLHSSLQKVKQIHIWPICITCQSKYINISKYTHAEVLGRLTYTTNQNQIDIFDIFAWISLSLGISSLWVDLPISTMRALPYPLPSCKLTLPWKITISHRCII